MRWGAAAQVAGNGDDGMTSAEWWRCFDGGTDLNEPNPEWLLSAATSSPLTPKNVLQRSGLGIHDCFVAPVLVGRRGSGVKTGQSCPLKGLLEWNGVALMPHCLTNLGQNSAPRPQLDAAQAQRLSGCTC